MSVYVATHSRTISSKSRRSAKLMRRVLLLCIPVLMLLFGLLLVRQSADANTVQSAVYYVQPGDSLWKIARQHAPEETDVRAYVRQLRILNDLEQSVIQTGQSLLLPSR